MKTIKNSLLFLLFPLCCLAQEKQKIQIVSEGDRGLAYEWAHTVNVNGVRGHDALMVLTDEKDNVYFFAKHQQGGTFDNGISLPNKSNTNQIFIAKYDNNGTYLWHTTLYGNGGILFQQAVIAGNSIYCWVNLYEQGKYYCNNTELKLPANYERGYALVKIDTETGAYQDNISTPGFCFFTGADGTSYCAGEMNSSFTGLHPGILDTDKQVSSRGIYVAKLDKDLKLVTDFIIEAGETYPGTAPYYIEVRSMYAKNDTLFFKLLGKDMYSSEVVLEFPDLNPVSGSSTTNPLLWLYQLTSIGVMYDFSSTVPEFLIFYSHKRKSYSDESPNYFFMTESGKEKAYWSANLTTEPYYTNIDKQGLYGSKKTFPVSLLPNSNSLFIAPYSYSQFSQIHWDKKDNMYGYSSAYINYKRNNAFLFSENVNLTESYWVFSQIIKYTSSENFHWALQIPIGDSQYQNEWYPLDKIRHFSTIPEKGILHVCADLSSHRLYPTEIDWNPASDKENILAKSSPEDPFRKAVIKYVETFRIKSGEGIQNGSISVPEKFVKFGGECLLSFLPDAGYKVNKESIQATSGNLAENTDGTYTLSDITEPVIVTAAFEIDNSMDVNTINADNKIKIYSQNQTIIIENVSEPVKIYHITGQCLAQGVFSKYTVSQAGIYIVQVSNNMQKVIVK